MLTLLLVGFMNLNLKSGKAFSAARCWNTSASSPALNSIKDMFIYGFIKIILAENCIPSLYNIDNATSDAQTRKVMQTF